MPGIAYKPNSPSLDVWRLSYRGVQLVGVIHRNAGALLSSVSGEYDRIPDAMTAEQCLECATKIKQTPMEVLLSNTIDRPDLPQSEIERVHTDIAKWIPQWIRFLESCNGYVSKPYSD